MNSAEQQYDAVTVGCSSGGLNALGDFLPRFPGDFPVPIVVVQHRTKDADGFMVEFLNDLCQLLVKEAEDKEFLSAGTVYVAPANYHLLLESDGSFSLDCDAEVRYSRPSIDVFFQSAADAFSKRLIAIILTGGNEDGRDGIRYIKSCGGITMAQDPALSEVDIMPRAAVESGAVDKIGSLSQLYSDVSEVLRQ